MSRIRRGWVIQCRMSHMYYKELGEWVASIIDAHLYEDHEEARAFHHMIPRATGILYRMQISYDDSNK